MRDEQRRRRAFEAKPEGPGTPNPFHTTPGAAMDEMSTEPNIIQYVVDDLTPDKESALLVQNGL
uniref:Uncharacterized protein n=1 Tax=Magnetococcus massalia (strain MO-1) TaxID=451514 RepID=A0A1S7LMA0_MAGMO|nr:protein of unknown function [Candidatus Magnetococcus massalia]